MQVLAARGREIGAYVSLKWKVAWELSAEKFIRIRCLQDCRRRREAVEEEVFLIIYGNSENKWVGSPQSCVLTANSLLDSDPSHRSVTKWLIRQQERDDSLERLAYLQIADEEEPLPCIQT